MRRALFAVLLLAPASCAEPKREPATPASTPPSPAVAPPSPAVAPPSPVPTTCIPLAEARARAADAHKRNEERYLAALAKQGLLPIVLPARVVDARRDDGGDAVPRVITRHVDGRRVRVLVSQPNAACDFDPGRLKLARNAKGKLYSVDLRPKVPPPDYLLACGCTEYHFTCGGAAPRPVVAHYTLHPGLDYKGSITIEHAAEPTSVLFTDKQPDGSACPPPPDPPP